MICPLWRRNKYEIAQTNFVGDGFPVPQLPKEILKAADGETKAFMLLPLQ